MICRLFVFLCSTLFLFSCGEFLKGKPKEAKVIEYKKESLNCLKGISKQWSSFLKSETTTRQIEEVFACLDTTLSEFSSQVDGRAEAQSFTAEELFQIFETFIEDAKVSKEAAADLITLKAAILGGGADKITKKEISDLRAYLLILKQEVKALSPYAKVLQLKSGDRVYSKKFIGEAFDQVNLSLKNLLKASKIDRADYKFSDLQKLIVNLKILDEKQSDLLKLAFILKDALAGSEEVRGTSEYLTLIENLTEVLRLYTVQIQGYVKFEIENPDDMMGSLDYVRDWVQLFEKSLQFKKYKLVSIETLDPLLKQILERDLIPVKLQAKTLLDFYKILLLRAFGTGIEGNVSSVSGLTKVHFVNMKREIAIYKMYMQAINDLGPEVLDQNRLSLASVQEKMKAFQPEKVTWFKEIDPDSQKSVATAFGELRAEFISSKPVIYRARKMVVSIDQSQFAQNWSDLARAFYVKMLTRELLLGWGTAFTSKEVMKATISEAGLVQWYAEFRQFGIEMRSFDPRSENSGASSFKQANLLTYSADGDDKMNFYESVQYLNMLIAGGGESLSEIQRGAKAFNCELPDKDAFGHPWLTERCVMADLRLNFKTYFVNLPYLVAYAEKLDNKKFYEFYLALMQVARINPALAGDRVETGDLRAMLILLHSIESLFSTYDLNRNYSFSAAEIRGAYPRFKNFATKYAHDHARTQLDQFMGFFAQLPGVYGCYNQEDLIRESFIFLVYNGGPPKKSDINNLPCLTGRSLITFQGEVDRHRMINTFKILKSIVGP